MRNVSLATTLLLAGCAMAPRPVHPPAAPLTVAGDAEIGIDHLILGISDLERGIEDFERRAGVRPVFGGVASGARDAKRAGLARGRRVPGDPRP